MKKYHVNKNGEARECRARIRPCPHGDPDSHYSSLAEARVAAEARMAAKLFKQARKRDNTKITLLSPGQSKSAIQKILEDNEVRSVTPGRLRELTNEEEELAVAYQNAADELVAVFKEGDEYILPHQKFDDYAIEKLKGHPKFKYLGTGCDKTAFLHEETGMVYKVVFARAGNGPNQKPYLERYIRKEQELIAEIDDNFLKENKVRYAKNYFLTSNGIPVIGQEYLDPERYSGYPLDFYDPNLASVLGQKGFSDMHGENVMMDKETNEIVLYDCLQLGGYIIGDMKNDGDYHGDDKDYEQWD